MGSEIWEQTSFLNCSWSNLQHEPAVTHSSPSDRIRLCSKPQRHSNCIWGSPLTRFPSSPSALLCVYRRVHKHHHLKKTLSVHLFMLAFIDTGPISLLRLNISNLNGESNGSGFPGETGLLSLWVSRPSASAWTHSHYMKAIWRLCTAMIQHVSLMRTCF